MIYVIVTLSISLFLSPLLFVEHRNYEVVGGDVFMGSRKRPTTRNAKQRAGVPVPEGENFSVAKMVTIFFFFFFFYKDNSLLCVLYAQSTLNVIYVFLPIENKTAFQNMMAAI